MFDLNHFKALNDAQGHQAGDAVLMRFGVALNENFRKNDLLSRFGGDEFVVLPAIYPSPLKMRACECFKP